MKIILTGVAGLGKSTLAAAMVSSGLVDAAVPESFAWLKSASPDTSEGKKKLFKASLEWLRLRDRMIRSPSSNRLVFDRGPMDALHLWLVWGLASGQTWTRFFGHFQKLLSHIDLVVLIPWESAAPPSSVAGVNESELVRINQSIAVINNQSILFGITYQVVGPEKVLVLPRAYVPTEERVAIVRSFLETQALPRAGQAAR